ncbi:MAG: DnaJ domain-containing protein [Myxococcaceae bacterium]|nr:DnaJ domain-containing protein [Myxococcaceae bacterium]
MKPRQFWIRDAHGDVFGPLTHATIALFLENGLFKGALTASRDGINFDAPGHIPELRDAFPQALWSGSGGPSNARITERLRTPFSLRPPIARTSSRPDMPASPRTNSRPEMHATPRMNSRPDMRVATSVPPGAEPQNAIGRLPLKGEICFALQPLLLCHRAVSESVTGTLTLQNEEFNYAIYFRKGTIESVRSTRLEEDIGSFAVNQHLLSADQLQQARDHGGDLIEAFFALNLISLPAASDLMTKHRTSLLYKAVLFTKGTFSFDPDAPRPKNTIPLGERWAPLCHVARALPHDRVLAGLEYRVDKPVMPSGGILNVDITQLNLTAHERHLAAKFDGTKSLTELCQNLSPAEAHPLLRTAYQLACFEIIAFAGDGAQAQEAANEVFRSHFAAAARLRTSSSSSVPRQNSSIPRTSSSPVVPRQSTSSTAIPRQNSSASIPRQNSAFEPPVTSEVIALRQVLEELKSKNHFEVLGVPPTAEGSAFKVAFFKLAKTYHPDTAIGAPPEVASLKAAIFSRMNEAYSVLDNPKRRAEYIDGLQNGGSSKIDVANVLAAEEKYAKVAIFLRNRRYQDALALMDEVIALCPKEGEFIACRAFTAFLVAQDKAAEKPRAIRAIEEGIKLNPRCVEAFIFRGHIEKLTGDTARARASFQKALEINPKHVEAQRELKWLDKK